MQTVQNARSEIVNAAKAAAGDAGLAIKLAATLEPPSNATAAIGLLFDLGEIDLTVARVIEPHLDALTILGEAGLPIPDGVFGVFAAEAPDRELRAKAGPDGWQLSGVKAWCSLADRLDRALVTATTSAGRQLFAVDLHQPGVRTAGAPWVSRGLTAVVTSDVSFEAVPAHPVGETGWYLRRPGFAWGGVRVAACWAGATQALVTELRNHLARRPQADPIRSVNLGRADVAAWTAGLALSAAGSAIDMGLSSGAVEASLLAARTRAVVAEAAETVLREVGHALGPAPLTFNEDHARRVADLTVYVRQHHGERDLSVLGEMAAT